MDPSTNLIDIVIPLVMVVATVIGIAITVVLDIRHKMKQRRAGFQPTDHAAGIPGAGAVSPAAAQQGDPPPAWVLQESDLLPAPRWLRMLNEQPDDIPHLMIVGPTGAGKTTFATALLSRRAGLVVVLSPKVKPSDWGGAPVISLDDTGGYGLLQRAVAALEAERRRRLVTLRQGGALTPLTVVLDEVPDLVDYVKGTGDLIRTIGGMGRELGMRMLLCSSSTLVNDLGIKGRGSARSNYAQVVLTPQVGDQPRGGVLSWGKVESDLDLKLVKTLAGQGNLGARGWAPPRQRPLLDEDLPEVVAGVEMVSSRRDTVDFRGETAISETREMREYIVATPETDRNVLLQDSGDEMAAQAMAVARMVAAGRCNETDGIKIVFGVTPGSSARYQAARAALKLAQEQLGRE